MRLIGRYIRENVMPAGLSVSEAARQLGVGRPALSNLLNGHAALSHDMALRLEQAFGADAQGLLRRQADIEARYDRAGKPEGYLTITAADIVQWAASTPARTRLPVLLRRLVRLDAGAGASINFPGHEAGERPGWDGHVEAAAGGQWVPPGQSGWELSVSRDLPGKPQRDYDQRLLLPEAERQAMSFVFVTAQSWPGKDRWAQRQRARGDWADVRAIDVADLEQWLERSPTTQVWLLEQMGRSADGLQSVASCWTHWAEAAAPALVPELFDEALAAHRSTLWRWLEAPSERPFLVAADSADEALAFLALALRDQDGGDGARHDEAVLVTRPEALRRVAAAAPGAVLIVADRDTEAAAASLASHHVIVVRPRASVEAEPDIALASPSVESFDKALEAMGLERHRREQLLSESGLSRTILRRRLARTPALRSPAWAQEPGLVRRLMPMLLAGAWHRSVEADRMIVEELADRPFDEVESDLADLLRMPDTPVWAIGDYRGVVSRKDALFAAGAGLRQGEVDRFFDVAQFVLSEDDPALDLPPEDRWAANVRGKSRDVSSALRRAIGELLVLLAVHGEQTLGPHLSPVCPRVDRLVSSLLRDVEARRWLSQRDDLPLLAEASPRAFLEAVEADLRSYEPRLLAMLRPVVGSFDSPDRTGLLWALETIAWNEAHLFRVGRILARLSEVPIDDNWMNRPESSLTSLIRSWLPQTAAPIERRLALLDVIAREFPAVGWRLCLAQVSGGPQVATPNATPRWRPDALGTGHVSDEEHYRMVRHALDLLLGWPELDSDRLGDLVEHSGEWPIVDQRRVWTRVEQWLTAGPADDARAMLRERMRRSVLSRRRARRGPTRLDERRRRVFEALAPADAVERHRWLFAEHWVSESGDDLEDEHFDYRQHEARIDAARRLAIGEIIAANGLDGVGRLLEGGNAWATVGRYLALTTPHEARGLLVADLVERVTGADQWHGCLAGALLAVEPAERTALVRGLLLGMADEPSLRLFKAMPFEGETWSLLAELRPALGPRYWREVSAGGWRHDSAELNILIDRMTEAGRPVAAFNAVAFDFERVEGATLARLFQALVRAREDEGGELHAARVSDALDALQASGAASIAELAQFEFAFIGALSHSRHGIPNLERQLAVSPADYVNLAALVFRRDDGGVDPPELQIADADRRQALGSIAYRVLDRLKRTPGTRDDGTIDRAALIAWITQARERFGQLARRRVGDSQIGQLLGRTIVGADGIWPNEAVRDALEQCGGEDLLRGVEIGLFNSRGVVWRAPGGTQERALAAKYRGFAAQLQATHPVTARLLDNIAEGYERQARSEDAETAVRQRLQRF